jgi:hypothetical protein
MVYFNTPAKEKGKITKLVKAAVLTAFNEGQSTYTKIDKAVQSAYPLLSKMDRDLWIARALNRIPHHGEFDYSRGGPLFEMYFTLK